MKVWTNPENPTRGLVFEFATESADDAAANAARWDEVETWLETTFGDDNRSGGGLLNGRFAYVTLRFEQFDRMPAVRI